MKDNKLENLRTEIDNLDQKIQALITSRAELAKEVAKVKKRLIHRAHFIVLKEKPKFLNVLLRETIVFLKIRMLH